MTPFEQHGLDRIVDAAIRFANRIDELERELKQLKAQREARKPRARKP